MKNTLKNKNNRWKSVRNMELLGKILALKYGNWLINIDPLPFNLEWLDFFSQKLVDCAFQNTNPSFRVIQQLSAHTPSTLCMVLSKKFLPYFFTNTPQPLALCSFDLCFFIQSGQSLSC